VNIAGDTGGDMGHLDFAGQVSPDLSLVYSAAILREAGHTVVVYDCNGARMSVESMFEELAGQQYDLVLLKACAPSVQADLKVASRLKELLPGARLVLCGHVAQILQRWIRDHAPYVDDVTTEPTEDYVYRLCHPDHIGPVNLRDFPAPAYDLFPHENYRERLGKKIAYLWGSRGCPLTCSYCPYIAFYGHSVDERPVDMLLDDMRRLNDMGIRMFQFRDPFFTANPRRSKEFCRKLIDSGMEVEWYCDTRIDSISDELAGLMGAAGCKTIFFGVETASAELLRKYKRPVYSVERAQRAIAALRNAGVDTMGLYIVGFPEETWEDIHNTYRLAENLDTTYAQFNVYIPYPDTTELIQLEEVTPEAFELFSNQMSKAVNPHISLNDLRFVAEQFSLMYNINRRGLKKAYDFYRVQKAQQKRAAIRMAKYQLA